MMAENTTGMKRQIYFDKIQDALLHFASKNSSSAKLNLSNVLTHSENYIVELLNMTYGYILTDANEEEKNHAAIDGVDKENKILLQTTVTMDKDKFKNSVEHQKLSKYTDYEYIYFYIGDDSRGVENFKVLLQKYITKGDIDLDKNKLKFSKDNIWDIHTLLDKIKSITDTEKLAKIANLYSLPGDRINLNTENLVKQGDSWTINIHQFYYINIPRISDISGRELPQEYYDKIEAAGSLNGVGYIVNIMNTCRRIVQDLDIKVKVFSPDEGVYAVGDLVDFTGDFRTKNVPTPKQVNEGKFSLNGSLSTDPHLYIKGRSSKLILTLDPRWLATDTSYVNFRMGKVYVAGIARITRVDGQEILATPYFLGTPKNEVTDLLDSLSRGGSIPRSININSSMMAQKESAQLSYDEKLDILVTMCEDGSEPEEYPLLSEACDICRRVLKDDKYIIDGKLRASEMWAWFCSRCFYESGVGQVGCGIGQLYQNMGDVWLLVAGGCKDIEDEPDEEMVELLFQHILKGAEKD